MDKNIKGIVWNNEYISKLPDSAFAYIGKDGKRCFPYRDIMGKINIARLRECLAEVINSPIGDKAMPALKAAAKKMKIDEYAGTWKGGEGQFMNICEIDSTLLKNEKYKPNDDKREVVLPLLVEGWGNQHDKNYYTEKAVVESASYLAARKKMYLNHPHADKEDRDIRDWGASIVETFVDTLPSGKKAALGRCKIHDKWLWERIKDAPDEIGTSLIGRGKAKVTTVEGREANVIESIEYVKSCDFVDYPGNTPMGMVYFVESEKFPADDVIEEKDKNKNTEDTEMTFEELTIVNLTEARKDLVEQIQKSGKEESGKQIAELDAKIKELEKTNLELKGKVDTHELKDKQNAKKEAIGKLLKESKLPESAQTETFREILMSVEEKKSGDKTLTIEEQVKTLINDRLVIMGLEKGIVQGMGKEADKDVKEAEAQKAFNSGIFGIKEEEKK